MQQAVWRSALAITCLAVVATACGSDGLSLVGYTASLDAAAAELGEELAAGDARMSGNSPTVQDARAVLAQALIARQAFQERLVGLDPPDEFADLHVDLVEVHARIIAAQESFAARAEQTEGLDELDQSAEAQAYRSMVEESVSVCEEFLARITATGEREVFDDVPWIPDDMKEVVEVTFGC